MLYTVGKSNNGYLLLYPMIDGHISKGSKCSFKGSNFPMLFEGMMITATADRDKLLSYDFNYTERNKALIEDGIAAYNNKQKADCFSGITMQDYRQATEIHKALYKNGGKIPFSKCLLCKDDLAKAIYQSFPDFSAADDLFKRMGGDLYDAGRWNMINQLCLSNIENRGKIAADTEEYLYTIRQIEKVGAFENADIYFLTGENLEEDCFYLKNGLIYNRRLYDYAVYIKKNIYRRLEHEHYLLDDEIIENYLKDNTFLDSEQRECLYGLKLSSPTIITGGAGTGKTTVVRSLIECYESFYGKDGILLAAPTGKASRNIAEKTGRKATTIHRLLCMDSNIQTARYNERNQLDAKLVIIDESSMINLELMYALLRAVPLDCKIVFVGDHNQLSPIGYGEPFFKFLDVIKPYRLSICHRINEDTEILKVANLAKNGEPITGTFDGVFMCCIDRDELCDYLDEGRDDGVQIISPYRAICEEINNALKKGNERFNVGDKVITLKNTKYYSNGDIGEVTRVYEDGVEILVNDVYVVIEDYKLSEHLDLAYCITVHKMQGSECRKVIVFLPQEGNDFIESRMLYTAFTRARETLEIYYYAKQDKEICFNLTMDMVG